VIADVVINPPLWIELSAVVVGAIAGALFATRRGLDLVGVLAVAIVAGLGGGMIRDLLLSTVPAALTDPAYLVAVVIAAVVGAFFASAIHWLRWPMNGLESLSLGLFAVIGTQKALSAGLPVAAAILLGVITGIGGSLLRDLFTGVIPPEAFQRGSPFASVAALAAATYVFLVRGLHVQKVTAEIAVIVLVVLVRSVAIWRGWTSPAATDLTPRKLRPRSAAPEETHEPEDGQEPGAEP
jgi:uncharacterized membrane protein YeiH